MNRRLDPSLFSTSNQPNLPNELPPVSPKLLVESQKLEIQEIRNQIRDVITHIEVLNTQFTQISQTLEGRLQKQSQAISALEKHIHKNSQDLERKIQHTNSQIQDKKEDQIKIESLLERQSMMMQNFENKLASLQRVLKEKDLMLLKYQSALQQLRK